MCFFGPGHAGHYCTPPQVHEEYLWGDPYVTVNVNPDSPSTGIASGSTFYRPFFADFTDPVSQEIDSIRRHFFYRFNFSKRVQK